MQDVDMANPVSHSILCQFRKYIHIYLYMEVNHYMPTKQFRAPKLLSIPTRSVPDMPTVTMPTTGGIKKNPRIITNEPRYPSALERLATIHMKIIKSVLYRDTSAIVGPLQDGNVIHYTDVFSFPG